MSTPSEPAPPDALEVAPEEVARPSPFGELRLVLGLVVALLGLVLYVNTLGHQYVLDDYGLIVDNAMTRQGFGALGPIFVSSYRAGTPGAPDGLYRPLSKATFAIEWSLAPGYPRLGHGINVVLYALTGFLLFSMLCRYLRGQLFLPFVASVLFIAHPLHTEVVANIKGRDEILAFLFFVLAASAVHRYATQGDARFLPLGAGAFFLSLLSKESSIAFLVVIPLMLFFFTDTPRPRALASAGGLTAAAALFLLIRHWVLAGVPAVVAVVENYLIAIPDVLTQKATAMYLLGVYLKLLFIPTPLISLGSYPYFPTVGIADWRVLLSAAVYLALLAYALLRLRRKDPVAFGILSFLLTLAPASNLLFTIGTNYGERLLYAPSFGFCLAVAALLARAFRAGEETDAEGGVGTFVRVHRIPLVAVAVVVALYGAQTVTRNNHWHDSLTLYRHDVRSAPASALPHFLLGRYLITETLRLPPDRTSARQALLTEAIAELKQAVSLYPGFDLAAASLGVAHQELGDTATARTYLEEAVRRHPDQPVIRNDYGNLLRKTGDLDGALKQYELAVRYSEAQHTDYVDARVNFGLAVGRLGEQAAKRAVEERNRGNLDGFREHMTEAHKHFVAALVQLKRAYEIAPDDREACRSVAVIYDYLGDRQNARDYMARCDRKRQG